MNQKFTCLLIDDHALIREGIASALQHSDYHVLAQAQLLSEAQALLNAKTFDFIILDINLPGTSMPDIVKFIRNFRSHSKIVMLTMNQSFESMLEAKSAGALAYVVKNSPISELIHALDFLQHNGSYFPVTDLALPKARTNFGLTNREVEILMMLPTGLTVNEMASLLFLSKTTVKTHLSSIYRKLGVSNRIQAIGVATDNELIPLK